MKTKWAQQRNLTMLADFYELTMANGYLQNGLRDKIAVFDMFFRDVPNKAGFAIFAGLQQVIDYVTNLKFTSEDIEYLRDKNLFCEEFLNYLSDFEFCCDVWSMEEGTPIFPNQPVLTVRGPVIQAQLLETMILLTVNFQSLIATKANRIVRAAQGKKVLEFGSRRAQSSDAAILGARAAYIGGCHGTSCTIADRVYSIPASGTMAHSWVQMFDNEYDAFARYATVYPDSCVLLVDTYNVLKSGIPNAIRVFDEIVKPKGHRPLGVRIDSGDIAYLSKRARRMLDDAGYPDVEIIASNSLDEYIIRDLFLQGARVDSFGVGENLITSKSDPVFGGVFKLVAVQNDDGSYTPKIKISESIEKVTTPHFKEVYRLFSKESGMAVADYIAIKGEELRVDNGLTIFDPVEVWKKKYLSNIEARPMLKQIFLGGKLVYQSPELSTIRDYCLEQVDLLWDEVKRFENPHRYYVDLSFRLWDVKNTLLSSYMSKY